MSYDIQQVCENGHQITGCYNISTDERQKFCQECGAPTIMACPECNAGIQGDRIDTGWDRETYSVESADVPSHCGNCGKPYPWTKKIATAIQMFAESGNLDDEEKKTIEQDINNIAKDIPEAKTSAMRMKRLWEKYGPLGRKIIMDFASSTAAKILKNPYTL